MKISGPLSKVNGQSVPISGHRLLDLSITILETVKTRDEFNRKEREHYCIRKFNTFYGGLNRQP